MGSLGLWKEPQSPSPDPSKGWMCNLNSWTGSSRPPPDPVTVRVGVGEPYRARLLSGRCARAQSRDRGRPFAPARGVSGARGSRRVPRSRDGGRVGRAQVPDGGGQGTLPRLVEVGGDPRVERRAGGRPDAAATRASSSIMSPRKSRGGAASRAGVGDRRGEASKNAWGCRAIGRPGASGRRRRPTGRAGTGRVLLARPWPAGPVRAASTGRRARCTRGRRSTPLCRRCVPRSRRGPVGVGVVVEEQVEPGRAPEIEQAHRVGPWVAVMWHRAGSRAVHRPTSFVCVVRVATSRVSSWRWTWQKSAKAAATSPRGAGNVRRVRQRPCRTRPRVGARYPTAGGSARRRTAAGVAVGRAARGRGGQVRRGLRRLPGRWRGRWTHHRARP